MSPMLGMHDKRINNDDVLDDGDVEDKYYISEKEEYVLEAWDEFYQGVEETVIGFPIWAEYFRDKDEEDDYPAWKKEFVRKNKKLYENNKEFIDAWLDKYDNLRSFTPTQRKMEWQAGDKIDSLWDGVIQFRPSGIRVKTDYTFPALVAIVQVPIIGRYRRRLHVTEDEIRIIEEKYHMFSDAMAKEISAFYFSVCDKIDCLICQCEHGQSRSAAVAAAILEFRNKKGIKVFASDRYYPNKVVFRKMLMALKNFENTEKRL